MPDQPLRVTLDTPSHLVRGGLLGLIAQMRPRAVVVDWVTTWPESHDVTIFDLGAPSTADRDRRAAQLLDADEPVVGLQYVADPERPKEAPRFRLTVSLMMTAGELLQTLERAVAQRPVSRHPHAERPLPANLTEREFEVIALLAGGLANREIGALLHVSDNTVKTYIRTAYRKMRVTNRVGAMLWATEHGLVGAPTPRASR